MDLASGRFGWTFKWKLFSWPLLGWYPIGVLSSSQTVGANVGVRLPETIKLQREREIELEREKENNTESKANSCSKIPPTWGSHTGLFILGGQGSHYNVLNALNRLPRQ
jgi:hypothetical protein